MKLIIAALVLLSVLNAGLACLSPLRGQAFAAALEKEALGKLSIIQEAIDFGGAAEAAAHALGHQVEPNAMGIAEWLTQERGAATMAMHDVYFGVLLINSGSCLVLAAFVTLANGQRRRFATAVVRQRT